MKSTSCKRVKKTKYEYFNQPEMKIFMDAEIKDKVSFLL